MFKRIIDPPSQIPMFLNCLNILTKTKMTLGQQTNFVVACGNRTGFTFLFETKRIYLNTHKIPRLEQLSIRRDLCPFSLAFDLLVTVATYADIFGSGKK